MQDNPEKYQLPLLLDSPCAVQISACTGAARRVKLRELVSELLPKYVTTLWNLPREWTELRDEHDIIEALRSRDIQEWRSTLTPDQKKAVEDLVRALLAALVRTGVDKQNSLVIPAHRAALSCQQNRTGLANPTCQS